MEEIASYLLLNAGLETAIRVVAEVEDRIRLLASTPGMIGQPRPELGPDVRSFASPPFVIFLRYIEGNGFMEIVRVRHERRELPDRM